MGISLGTWRIAEKMSSEKENEKSYKIVYQGEMPSSLSVDEPCSVQRIRYSLIDHEISSHSWQM
jgi:hypothetical protein